MSARLVRRACVAIILALAAPLALGKQALEVYAVNYPLAYFAGRIGGEAVKVVFPVPRGVDPAFWNPDAKTIANFQSADLILLNGAGYARWVARASLPRRRLVDTSKAFRDRFIRIEDAVTHAHGPSGAHAHAGTAFVTWLDPQQAIAQARAITRAFSRAHSAKAQQFEEGLKRLVADLETLDRELEAALQPFSGQPIVASHPIYQYLARRYALELKSVTWEPDQPPGAAEWRTFGKLLEGHRAHVMLWEAPPADATAARLSALGLRSVVFDPCANRPAEGDFMRVMRDNVAALRAIVVR
jgi:zinc transport system substrate-binding protein